MSAREGPSLNNYPPSRYAWSGCWEKKAATALATSLLRGSLLPLASLPSNTVTSMALGA